MLQFQRSRSKKSLEEEEEEGIRNREKPDTLKLMKTHMFMYSKLFYCARYMKEVKDADRIYCGCALKSEVRAYKG